MTLIQLIPTEIRELNLNQFHLWLKDAEDSEDGMPFPATHNHNTEVILGGIVYARVIEMINGYTVTFEDGMYAVNLVGANSNVGDVVNVNSVSVRSQNSAGLISTQTMEYSSFDDCVAIDVVTGVAGTVFPTGTKLRPSNNLTDALLIASVRGITRLLFLSDYTFPAGTLVANMTLMGEGMQRTTLTFQPGSIIAYCFLRDARVTGRMTGVIGIDDCHVMDFGSVGLVPTSQTIIVRQCLLDGEISLPSNYSGTLKALDCWSNTPGAAMPILNMGGSTANLLVRNYSGDLELRNQTAPSYVEMDFVSGHLTLESTVTAGTFLLRGIGTLEDNSTGTTVDVSGLVNADSGGNSVLTFKTSMADDGTTVRFIAWCEESNEPKDVTSITAKIRDRLGALVVDLGAGIGPTASKTFSFECNTSLIVVGEPLLLDLTSTGTGGPWYSLVGFARS